jgi:hypothetical protein
MCRTVDSHVLLRGVTYQMGNEVAHHRGSCRLGQLHYGERFGEGSASIMNRQGSSPI